MNFLLIISAILMGWTALHIIAVERERRMQESRARAAKEVAAHKPAKHGVEQPIIVS